MKRRDFLKVSFVAIAGATLAACRSENSIPSPTPLPVEPGEVKNILLFSPGSTEESIYLVDGDRSTVQDGARIAESGNSWSYHLTLFSSGSGLLSFESSDRPDVYITSSESLSIQGEEVITGNVHQVKFNVPGDHPSGSLLQITLKAVQKTIAVKNIRLVLKLPDTNGDGIPDSLARLMGASVDEILVVTPLPDKPHTSFFYAGDYDPRLASPTDTVRLYSYSTTWDAKGYAPQVMIHSRFRPTGEQSLDEVQTDAEGNLWGVAYVRRDGKLIDVAVGALSTRLKLNFIDKYKTNFVISMDEDYYKVPTLARNELAKHYYADQLAAGASGIGFDEPEYWAATGYSEAFKREWQAFYGSPWQPPASSVHARYKSEPLKGWLFVRQVQAILRDALKRKPDATRLISLHSPINYYEMGIVAAHSQLVQLPEVQEIIAEVWSGTAKTPVPLAGERTARTFAVAYLEYSSFWHLVRDLGKRLWFLQDPMEDMPNLSLQEYVANYSQTVVAALMFPQVDCYEVLVWPNRIFGTVPGTYETVINSITGMFSELWRYPAAHLETGSEGIGVFVADSMGWQRGEPAKSDYDGFYGLTLPLISRGIPVQVLSLDRVINPGYLQDFKTLLVTYDYLKPSSPEINSALADWCQAGGTLLFFGGTDTYNIVEDAWWNIAGYSSPGQHLLECLGLPVTNPRVHQYTDIELQRASSTSKLGKSPEKLKVSRTYPVTLFPPPVDCTVFYSMDWVDGNQEISLPAIWQVTCGKGNLMYTGVAPGFFSTSPQAVHLLIGLVSNGYKKAGGKYLEKGYFLAERGPYVAVHCLNHSKTLRGRFISLFDPNLKLKEDPAVKPGESGLFFRVKVKGNSPHLLYASGRVYASYETDAKTSFLVRAPYKSRGVARVWAGKNKVVEMKACNLYGIPIYNRYEIDEQTLYLQYDNDPDGVVVTIVWDNHS